MCVSGFSCTPVASIYVISVVLSGYRRVPLFIHSATPLTLSPPNYLIWIFTHLKLCLADAIHNFKWIKNIQISNIINPCHILSLTCLKGSTECGSKN